MTRDSDPTTHPDDFDQNRDRQTNDHDVGNQTGFDGDQEPNGSELSAGSLHGVPASKNRRKRRLIAGVAFMIITIGVLLFAYYTFSPSHSVKVNIRTKQSGQAQDATAKPDKGPDEVTADAIAQVRSAMATSSPGPNPNPTS